MQGCVHSAHGVTLCLWGDDDLIGAELITEPVCVNQYNRLCDLALHNAIPYGDFVAQLTAERGVIVSTGEHGLSTGPRGTRGATA